MTPVQEGSRTELPNFFLGDLQQRLIDHGGKGCPSALGVLLPIWLTPVRRQVPRKSSRKHKARPHLWSREPGMQGPPSLGRSVHSSVQEHSEQPQEEAQTRQGLHVFHAQQGRPNPGLHPLYLQCCPGLTLGPLQPRSAFGGAICTLFRARKEKGPPSAGSVLWGQLCRMTVGLKLAGATLLLPCFPGG